MKIFSFVLLALCIQPAVCQAHYVHDGKYALPDSKFTPGAIDSRLIADTSGKHHVVNRVEANLCAKDFRTGPWRKVSESEKKNACKEYGITEGCPGPAYELDHLISLEIGGSDDVTNLWPQPLNQARIKDHGTEDPLPKLVCSGKITLKDAQECISKDWVSCMEKVKSLEGGKK